MKKLFLVGLLSMVLATGGVFAQEVWGGKKNFVSGEVNILGAGARYERLLTPKFSIGADGYWSRLFPLWEEIEAGAFGRFYIWKGLFAELGLGFHIHFGTETKAGGIEFVQNTGFAISPAIGWKFDPGKAGGFFMGPVVRVPITLGEKDLGRYFDKEFGASVAAVVSLGLGWAF